MPPIGRSLGHGLLAVVSSPVLLAIAVLVPLLAWLALYALGFEGRPALLVDVLALPPIATYFDLGTGESLLGLGPSFLIFTGVAILIRGVLYGLLAGMIVESLEDGRVSSWGLLRGIAAIPTVIVVQVLSFTLILASNIIFPVLGPGIGLLAAVGSLVGGLFFLGFAPTAAVRQRRGVVETIRRSGRAAMLPGSRHLLFCGLYFFVALPVVVGLAPGGGRGHREPDLPRLGLRAGRERAPPGLHGRARLPLDRRRALRPRATGEAPFGFAAPAPRGVPRAGVEPGRGPRTAATPLVDSAFAGVSTPSSHARGSPAGSRPGFWVKQRARSRERQPRSTRPGRWRAEPGGGTNRKEGTMPVVTRRELLEAGVHFGHQTRRWNPKMGRYLYGERSGIYIIDLEKTLSGLEEAYAYARDLGRRGGVILFVGTKKQAQEVISEHAARVGMPFVTTRWLGGMLTNFQTVSRRLLRLRELREMERTGAFDFLPKRRRSACGTRRRSSSATSAACRASSGSPTRSS